MLFCFLGIGLGEEGNWHGLPWVVGSGDGLGMADVWRSHMPTAGALGIQAAVNCSGAISVLWARAVPRWIVLEHATVVNTAVIPAGHIRRTHSHPPRLAGWEEVLSWARISLVLCPRHARCDAQRQCSYVTGAGHAPMSEAHRRRACVTELEVRSRQGTPCVIPHGHATATSG